jgi:hypothetical protein
MVKTGYISIDGKEILHCQVYNTRNYVFFRWFLKYWKANRETKQFKKNGTMFSIATKFIADFTKAAYPVSPALPELIIGYCRNSRN